MLLNNVKQEQTNVNPCKSILDLTNVNLQNMISNQLMSTFNLSMPIKQESSTNFKRIEQSVREQFQYSQPLPIPNGSYFLTIFRNFYQVQQNRWLCQCYDHIYSNGCGRINKCRSQYFDYSFFNFHDIELCVFLKDDP